MAESGIDYSALFAKNLPEASGRWGGFPKYNFIGGHNNPDEIPVEDLIEASARVLRQDGRGLATYNMDSGPLLQRTARLPRRKARALPKYSRESRTKFLLPRALITPLTS